MDKDITSDIENDENRDKEKDTADETEPELETQKDVEQTPQKDILSDDEVYNSDQNVTKSTGNTTSQPDQDDFLNLFGGGDDFAALASTTPVQTKPTTVQELTQDRRLWRKLFALHSAILYEDVMIQIGIKSQVESESGVMRVILYYGNKLNSSLLSITAQLSNVEGIETEISPSEPFDLEAQQQKQQKCRISMMQPPAGIPTMQISFSTKGEQYRITAHFPAVVTKILYTSCI